MLIDDIASLSRQAPPLSRRGFVTASVATGFAVAAGPIQAQTVITTSAEGLTAGEIQIPAAGGTMPGYRAMPAQGNNLPVVLVVQEIFGVHEHIRDVTRRLAKLGYLAVAPELYFRQGDPQKVTEIPAIMRDIVSKVSDAQVMGDLDATLAWARASGRADPNKAAITGFCWGGRFVWLYGAHNPNLTAGVAWYGRLVGQPNEMSPRNPIDFAATLKPPILGLYGGADPGIPNDTVAQMQAALKAANSKSEIVVYPDTPHGFHADFRASYRKEPAEDGWRRLQAWFRTHGAAPSA